LEHRCKEETVFVIPDPLTAKIVFETIGATAGLAKEGLGLTDKLRDRKSEIRGLLERDLSRTGNNSPGLANDLHELYDTLDTATKYVRRIVKRRMVVRVQALAIVAATSIFAFIYAKPTLTKVGDWIGVNVTEWTLMGGSFVLLYLGCSWFLRFSELKTSGRPVEEFSDLEKISGGVPDKIRAQLKKLTESMESQERSALTGLDRSLLTEFGKLSSLIDVLEISTLVNACKMGSLATEAGLSSEMDECVLAILERSENVATLQKPAVILDTALYEIFDRSGIGHVVYASRYSRGCGIASGSCRIMMVPANTYFRIYSGNALRLKDAKAFSIVEGEQSNGVDVVLPLRHLHQVAGVVVAKSDGHLLRGGTLQLLYADDHSVAHRTRVNDDGTFVFNLVQDGRISAQGARWRRSTFQKHCSDLPGANHAD
jgi:hypothetical protein